MKFIYASLLSSVFCLQAFACQDHLPVSDAVINLPLTPDSPAAGYFSIKNKTGKRISVVQIKSKDFKKIELHKMTQKGGSHLMKKVNKVIIEKGSSLDFKPGGFHLMLFEPLADVGAKKLSELVFEFSNGTKVKYDFSIQ